MFLVFLQDKKEKMSNTLPRTLCWFLATGLLFILLHLYWNRQQQQASNNTTSPICSNSVPLVLISLLFLQRGFVEVYRKFYTITELHNSSDSSFFTKIFFGRAALWARLALSLVLIVTVLFSVVESAAVIFEMQEKSLEEAKWLETTTGSKTKRNPNRPNDVHIKNSINNENQQEELNDEEDEAARRIYNRHSSHVDADRHTFDKLAKSQKNLEQHRNAFSPGAGVPHYYNHLVDDHDNEDDKNGRFRSALQNVEERERRNQQQEALCPLSTSFVSILILWAVYSGAVGFLFWDSTKSISTTTTFCWALHFDTFNEIKLAANVVICNVFSNWASHSWKLDPATEVPSYHNFITGLWMLYFEINFSCLPALRALTLALSGREVLLVEALEKAIKKEDENKNNKLQDIRAAKIHLGLLRLELDFEKNNADNDDQDDDGDDGEKKKKEILDLIRTSHFWERSFDLEDIRIIMI